MTPSPVQQEHIRQHRRETFIYLIVPLLLTVFIVLLGVVIVLLLQRQLQVSLLADWMVTVMMFCPALICSTIVCIMLCAAIFLMGRANQSLVRPLEQMNEATQSVADRAANVTHSINQTTIKAASQFAFFDRLLGIFDLPPEDKDTKEK